ncbi:MAG: 30S ribosomal protein S7 [Leptospirales bacterium]|nr:30S ribosomal protein S7 [Leptospirales bacterium]
MSRRSGAINRRPVMPDARYGDTTVSSFINYMMHSGKKSVAESLFYGALDTIKEKTGNEGLEVFRQAMENVAPQLEVRSRRVGGVTYQVPVEVRPARMRALAIRWLVGYARERKEHSMAARLANELIDASKNQGGAIKKRDDTRRMAEANRAFSHYRW